MRFSLRHLVIFVFTASAILQAIGPCSVRAQILPINNFTIADGLAHNGITQFFQDSNGYLWIATGEGLSRFDGYEFKNYGTPDGLTSSYINDVTADRGDRLWVAINDGGIGRFRDQHDPETDPKWKFVTFSISDIPRANNVGRIVFDSENRLWCATEGGVFRARNIDVADNDFELIAPDGDSRSSREALLDSRGRLWFGLMGRMLKIENGQLAYFDLEPERREFVTGIAEIDDGRLVASTASGVYQFTDQDPQWRRLDIYLEKDQSVATVASAGGGAIWIATRTGLINFHDGRRKLYTKFNGLAADAIHVIFTDRDKGLWLGTRGSGISHRTNNAIVNYSGHASLKPYRISGDTEGNVYVQAGCLPESTHLLKVLEDEVVTLPFGPVRTEGCRRTHYLRSSDGRWWWTLNGVLTVFDSVADSHGSAVRKPDGKILDQFTTMYEDDRSNLWISAGDRNLYFSRIGSAGAPSLELAVRDITAPMIVRDKQGALWLANNAFLGRSRDGSGQVEEIRDSGGTDKILPRALFEDSTGRIWIGTRFGGALYTDEPDASTPRFGRITTSDGLGSNTIWALGEDDLGGIYLGTGRGLFRYERDTGRLRPFTTTDGVPESSVQDIFKDRRGLIWVASDAGLLRIDPSALDRDLNPPRILISRVAVEGTEMPLPESGVSDFRTADLMADENSVSIQFVGLNLKGERSLSYRYRLEGHDQAWSPPTKQREVNFANLGAGTYRFLVKAIDQRGVESEIPAVLQFQILPPFWQRWWFLTLIAIAIVAVLYVLYRYRMAQVIALERVRTRIATDLHDDIGANLTRIALMSEVLNQQGPNGSANKMLPSIANIARESVASMNDIVWAISPEHDRVLDLTRRMRQHAEEVFTIRDIDVAFVSQSSDSELKLAVGVRRDVLLIFKEAVNNAARHSSCTSVEIEFECSPSGLRLRIADNGKGFDENKERDGHGLSSMERRSSSLGGKLEIRSTPGEGTTVDFKMPLR